MRTRNILTSARAVIFGLAVVLAPAGGLEAASAKRTHPASSSFSPERLARVDAFLQGKVDRGEMAGIVLLIAQRGQIIHQSSIGYADIEQTADESGNDLPFFLDDKIDRSGCSAHALRGRRISALRSDFKISSRV